MLLGTLDASLLNTEVFELMKGQLEKSRIFNVS